MTVGRDLNDRARRTVARRQSAEPQQQETQLDKRVSQVAGYLTRIQGEIQRALPRHMDADRMARLTLTAIRKTPNLALCTEASFAGALLTASALGLEPGVEGECYLVPYKNFNKRTESTTMECQLIVGYQGYTKLYYATPMAGSIDAQPVYENDDFDYELGTRAYLRHKPARGDRGEIVDYYALATLTSGATPFVVLSPEQVKELRGGKVGPSGDIADPLRWMERKTALRQLVKLLPKSPTLAAAAAVDERGGEELYRDRLAERGAEDELAGATVIDAETTDTTTDPDAPASGDTDNTGAHHG
ncbi:recombinase RecT [Nocardia neocaledoniensis]|uniref:recombinase RecT n=1 Tax=Nocardia neocaledoniensis TaxID=236511 RepID=UPI002456E020|nr:recombinase RecT [Nocardia neocaledoniensis]